MFLEIIFFFLGVLSGIITGLTPGIHVNLISIFLVSLPLSVKYPQASLVFIVALTITHTFLDFIPSIFLGAPDEDSSLSILPGHELLNKGQGYQAVLYTVYGGIIGVILFLFLTPFMIFLMPKVFEYLKPVMFIILVTTSVYLIFKEKKSRVLATIIFMLAGFLGLATLNLNIKNSLLPLLTGLFGASSLITSITKKQNIPKQDYSSKTNLTRSDIKNISLSSVLAAPLCSFLPALGSSQAAVIGLDLINSKDKKQFLMLLGSINIIVNSLAFVALFSIQKARTGAAVALQKILPELTLNNLFLILTTVVFSSFLAIILATKITKTFSKNINKISYTKLSIGILMFITLVSIIFSGALGFLVFLISTFTGLACILLKVRRTTLMGALMLPSILLYLPW